jgi:hypothetical protein
MCENNDINNFETWHLACSLGLLRPRVRTNTDQLPNVFNFKRPNKIGNSS